MTREEIQQKVTDLRQRAASARHYANFADSRQAQQEDLLRALRLDQEASELERQLGAMQAEEDNSDPS
jgi:hypothetical protein